MSPRGNARATYAVRGTTLPPWGTFADDAFVELLARERRERITAWELMATIIGSFLGHGAERIQQTVLPLRNAFADELFQKNYGLTSFRKKLVQRLKETKELNQKMDKLNKMAVN